MQEHEEGAVPVEPEPEWTDVATQVVVDEAPEVEPSQPSGEEAEEEPLGQFDERFRVPFEGLLYLGVLKRTFTWGGHTFEIQSMSTDDILKVGLTTQPYDGTTAQVKAYQVACIAASILSVDGQPLPVPVDMTADAFDYRFDYIKDRWWPPVIDVVYQEILNLEYEVDRVLRAMERAEGKPLG